MIIAIFCISSHNTKKHYVSIFALYASAESCFALKLKGWFLCFAFCYMLRMVVKGDHLEVVNIYKLDI